MDLVKVKNTHSERDLILRHDRQGEITLTPGQERIVPLEYATCNFGNPGARNEGKNLVRDNEYKSFLTRWGYYPGLMSDDEWDNGMEGNPGTKPSFEVYDLDDERIYMLLEDPKGEHAASAAGLNLGGERTDEQYLSQRINSLEQQLAQTLQLLGGLQPDTAVPVPTTPDSPSGADDDAAWDTKDGPKDPPAVVGTNTTEPPAADAQEKRNEQRDDIPKATEKPVGKDGPKTTRVGGT